MSDSCSKPARARWAAIPGTIQERILGNVWCGHCQQGTTMELQGGSIVAGDLVLSGVCARCGQKVARLLEGEAPAPPPFRVGDKVVWLKRIPGGEYVLPISATILAFTAKRVKIAAEDTEVSREPVVRYVPLASLQHRSRSSKR